MRKLHYIFLIFTILIVSCRTSKEPSRKKAVRNVVATNLLDSLIAKQPVFRNVMAKFKATITVDKKSNSLTGTLKSTLDSTLWLSFNPMGIEVARISLNPDSVFVLERMGSKYYKGTYSGINDFYNIDCDFKLVQSFFLNRFYIFNFTSANLDELIVKTNKGDDEVEVSSTTKRKARKYEQLGEASQYFQKVVFDKKTSQIKQVYLKDFKENRSITVDYSDFVYDDSLGVEFPSVFKIKVSTKQKDISVDLRYTKLSFNVLNEYPFSIPSTYKPIIPN